MGGAMKLMSTLSITLSNQELLVAATLGLQRQLECQKNSKGGVISNLSYENKYNAVGPGGLWNNSIEGALGEFALAKFLGLYPSGIECWNATDVGEHYEVRTRPKEFQELFLKKNDKKDKYFVLLQGSFGEYNIRGWISAVEAFSHPEWFHNNSGKTSFNYWIPHPNLHPMSTLPKVAPS